MNFKIVKSEIVHRGIVFDLKVDQIEYDSGNPGVRETALHDGGAVVVPVTSEGKAVLITQFRYPLMQWLTELPAGKLGKGEDPYICAVRELKEETGYEAELVEKLGAICTTPGFCTEILHIYIATGLKAGSHNREEGEQGMQVHEFTFEETDAMIREGKIIDAKTISGLTMAKLKLGK
ncbi:MAG: Methanol dehydrogenase activator [Ignavibacteriaceae bacterium]|nr:Methanol dehydrogenase activator [Ignavibacteriaceae bacterium]